MYSYLRTLFYLPINSIMKALLEIFVFDRQIRRILKGKLAKLYLKKYVNKAIKIDSDFSTNINNETETIIWQYWEQGIENAPDIVKKCVESVDKYKNGHKHIILDKNSVKEYIDIPDYIWKLNSKGIIKSAHLSDIIRTYLLAKYGGVWVDATVLFTQMLPDYVVNSELFVFQNELKSDLDGLNVANYFISSKPNNHFILYMKHILENYWKENRFVWNYFFYLHCFTMLTLSTKELSEKFNKVPFFSFIPVQRFQNELMDKFSIERWNQIKNMSFAHKLSYKVAVLNKNKLDIKDTFYEKLIKGELI